MSWLAKLAIAIAVVAGFVSFATIPFRSAATGLTVGMGTKVVSPAQVGTETAVVGTLVHMNDPLHTGAKARLEVTFRDKTELTLGENASVVVDRYVYDPDAGVGKVTLSAGLGAFRFATGQIKGLRDKEVTVTTPVAAIAVRGTDFWSGPIDGQYGVLLLKGKVDVSNDAGAVTLSDPEWGTDIPAPLKGTEAPGHPYKWPPDKVARALAQTDIGPILTPGQFVPLVVPLVPLIPGSPQPKSP